MEIKGTLMKICPTVDINLKDGGSIKKGGFVIMREGDYPKPVYFEMMGSDRLQGLESLVVGTPLRVFFYPESREASDGRYFTSLRCTGVYNAAQPQPQEWNPQPAPTPLPATTENTPNDGLGWLINDDETPF